jgi:hypothetical protein
VTTFQTQLKTRKLPPSRMLRSDTRFSKTNTSGTPMMQRRFGASVLRPLVPTCLLMLPNNASS